MTDYTAKTIILKDANGNYLIPYTEKQDRLSTAQLKAVDSGITSDKVNTYDSSLGNIQNKQDKLTETQLSAVNSDITSTKVSNYDTHLTNTDLHVTSAEKTTWNSKVSTSDLGSLAFSNKIAAGDIDGTIPQSTITNLESDLSSKASTSDLGGLAFKDKIVGSDITGTLAQGKIAGLTTALDNKQDVLTAGENVTIEEGVISADLDITASYDASEKTLTLGTDIKNPSNTIFEVIKQKVEVVTATGGTIQLESGKTYNITLENDTIFILPNTVNTELFNQIFVHLNISTSGVNIDWGTTATMGTQSISTNQGIYSMFYEYNNFVGKWTFGQMVINN